MASQPPPQRIPVSSPTAIPPAPGQSGPRPMYPPSGQFEQNPILPAPGQGVQTPVYPPLGKHPQSPRGSVSYGKAEKKNIIALQPQSQTLSAPTQLVPHSYLPPTSSDAANPRTPQRGTKNAFNKGTKFRWRGKPRHYQNPTHIPCLATTALHRDPMGRLYRSNLDHDRYISPYTAEVKKLVVATTDELYRMETPHKHTWRRTYIRNVGPWLIRVAYWPFKSTEDIDELTQDDRILLVAKWLPACIALIFLMPFRSGPPDSTNEGRYLEFPYNHWRYPKEFRNILENREDEDGSIVEKVLHGSTINPDPTSERLLRPTYLAYLRKDKGVHIADGTRNPENDGKDDSYVFVAYSTSHFSHDSTEDQRSLLEMAENAARKAGVPAFWCSICCMPTERTLQTDIYRMSDIIRGAAGLIVALKTPWNKGQMLEAEPTDLLTQWGMRMWTFPEALLSPAHKDIVVYTKYDEPGTPYGLDIIPKRDFARRAWKDAPEARQLIDHFEGSQILSRLELAVVAFRCLYRRRLVEQHFNGDLSYALMGLLRRRPKVEPSDTEFQAFARLSLANDSDCLLERLICLLPRNNGEHWLTSDDAWAACPWDIYPKCQVAGISDDDTVILDGCLSAMIEWSGFAPVAYARDVAWKRSCARFAIRSSPFFLLLFGFLSAVIPSAGITAVVVILVLFLLTSPYLVCVLYGGKIWKTDARLFGFEGYLDIKTIEYQIFGYSKKRMTWSAFGSPLSRHSENEYRERMGRDPIDDPWVQQELEAAKTGPFGTQRIFTIVDTLAMTATLIHAVRPPVCALVCGNEGGMLRSVLCSYDWKSQTLFREAVMRMETPSIDYMSRMPRVKFGFERQSNYYTGNDQNV